MMRLAVFGNPIAQSKSPQIHRDFAKQLKIAIEYDKYLAPIDNFSGSLQKFFEDPMAKGCNVTVPFKQQAAKWVNELSERARLADAVNTIIRTQSGKYIGDNTDGIGLVNDLKANGVKLENTRLLLLGAGGAARGVIKPLLDQGVQRITVANRTATKALELITLFADDRLQPRSLEHLGEQHDQYDLIINSTSASLSNELPILPDSIYSGVQAVYDMVYGDHPTVFMQHAKRLGVQQQIDGLGMLVQQAAESFFLWTGQRPETDSLIMAMRNPS